jgi:hypothetical protein
MKPRTVGELLDAAFTVYRRQFARLALVAIVISAPTVVVAAIYSSDAAAALREFTATVQDNANSNAQDPWQTLTRMLGAWGRLIPTSLLGFGLTALARAATALAMTPVVVAALRRAPAPGLGEIARTTAARIVPAFVLQLAFDLSWSTLSCCCPPVGLFVAALLGPACAILVTERGPAETRLRAAVPAFIAWPLVPFAACGHALVRGAQLSWDIRVFLRGVAFFTVLLLFIGTFTSAVTVPVAESTKESGHWFWVQHCAEMLFLPVVGLGRALWHFDLLARREGLDLEPSA